MGGDGIKTLILIKHHPPFLECNVAINLVNYVQICMVDESLLKEKGYIT